MTDSQTPATPTAAPPDPIVLVENAYEVAPAVMLIPDREVPLVPNIGIIGGNDAVLVIDTGLGVGNAQAVLAYAKAYAGDRRIFLTSTHFHPEHSSGAAAFAGHAEYLVNDAQADELAEKGTSWIQMFATLGEPVTHHVESLHAPTPNASYDGSRELDLGGRIVLLQPTGRAHTRGDQVVRIPDAGVLFTGDLVEAGQFPIFPWIPGHDTDVSGTRWLAVMRDLIASEPSIVVPGHGPVGGPELLEEVAAHLQLLHDKTVHGHAAAEDRDSILATATDAATAAHPDWQGREWIAPGIDSNLADLGVEEHAS